MCRDVEMLSLGDSATDEMTAGGSRYMCHNFYSFSKVSQNVVCCVVQNDASFCDILPKKCCIFRFRILLCVVAVMYSNYKKKVFEGLLDLKY